MSTGVPAGQRRFIAGAVCPRCAEMDKIVVYRDEHGEEQRECVRCGFREGVPPLPVQQEPQTRLARPQEKKVAAQPLQFVPNPNLKKKTEQ